MDLPHLCEAPRASPRPQRRQDLARTALEATGGPQRVAALRSYLTTTRATVAALYTLVFQAILTTQASEAPLVVADLEEAGIPLRTIRELCDVSLNGRSKVDPVRNPQARRTAHALAEACDTFILKERWQRVRSENDPEERVRFAYEHAQLDELVRRRAEALARAYHEEGRPAMGAGEAAAACLLEVREHLAGRITPESQLSVELLSRLIELPRSPDELRRALRWRKTTNEAYRGTPYLVLDVPA